MSPTDRRSFLKHAGAATAALATGAAGTPLAQGAPAAATVSDLPPHRPQELTGLFCYADRENVPAGEKLRVHVGSSVPYKVSVRRLGSKLDDPASDEIIHAAVDAPACPQPIHPGSYVYVPQGLADEPLSGLTLECWLRTWTTTGPWRGIITQYDEPSHCGWGLFIDKRGRIVLVLGKGGAESDAVETVSTPTERGKWHHVVATWDGKYASLWIDGVRLAVNWAEQPVRSGTAPIRLGAYGRDGLAQGFLDADLAMPAIYDRTLSPEEISQHFAQQGLQPAKGEGLQACWTLSEERGAAVADSGPHARHGRIINHGTWMIGGPSFNANVNRFGNYDPKGDPQRGHALRLCSDDLYDCRWRPVHEFTIPSDAKQGQYVVRFEYTLDDQSLVSYAPFIVTRSAKQKPARVLLLQSTHTWRAYNATPFAVTAPGLKTNWSTRGSVNSAGEPPAFCFYRGHAGGQGTYQLGYRMPWRGGHPYLLYGAEADYSHLARADRCTQIWLEQNGYEFDTVGDLDFHRHPEMLDDYKVLVISGHSEYWTAEGYAAMERFLKRGGDVVALSGNTMFWRVTIDDETGVLECRKVDCPGNQMPATQRGEAWHSHDGQRGGMMRECGYPTWRVIGLETLGWIGTTPQAFGPFQADLPDHFLFQKPRRVKLAQGETFGKAPDGGNPQADGHEFDVRISTIRKLCRQPIPPGAVHPDEPEGITQLAHGMHDWRCAKGTRMDYFTRVELPDNDGGADVIYWERPEGGRVFNTGSIGTSWAMLVDAKLSALVANALDHFLA